MKNFSVSSIAALVALCVAFGAGDVLGAGSYPEKPITLFVQNRGLAAPAGCPQGPGGCPLEILEDGDL